MVSAPIASHSASKVAMSITGPASSAGSARRLPRHAAALQPGDVGGEPAAQRLDAGDRLRDQPVGAGGADPLAVLAHGIGGQRHDRHARAGVAAGADRPDHVEPRQPRHLDVDDHEVDRLQLETLQRLDAVGADGDLGVERAQHLRGHHLVGGIVLGEQHPQPVQVGDRLGRRRARRRGHRGRKANHHLEAAAGRLPPSTVPPSRSTTIRTT